MTVTNTTVKRRFNCDGATVAFAIPFDYVDTDEVQVWLRNEGVSPITETLLVEGSGQDYTIASDIVTLATAYGNDFKILLKRLSALTQEVDYIDNDSFPASSHEGALDKLTRQMQELNDKFSGVITLPVSTSLSNLVYADPLAYDYLRWNSSGEELEGSNFVATTPLTWDPSTSTFAMPQASSGQSGYLSSTDWADFEAKITGGAAAIVDADISASAAITLSKLAPVTASRALVSDVSGVMSASSVTATELGYVSGVSSAIQTQINTKANDPGTTKGDLMVYTGATWDRLPVGSNTQVLTADSAQTLGIKWATGGGGGSGTVSGPVSSTDNALPRWDGTAGDTIQDSGWVLDDSDLMTGVDLILSSLTVTTVPYVDGSKQFKSSAVTPTELGYLSGVTSAIQTQLGTKITSGAAAIVDADVSATAQITRTKLKTGSANHVLINDGSGDVSSEAQLAMSRGGTNANLTAANGADPYCTGTAIALLAPGTATQVKTSGGAGAPTWQYGVLPQIFGSTASPRSVVAATGITTGASHMSNSANEQIIFVQGSINGDSVAATITVGTVVGQRIKVIGKNASATVTLDDATTTNFVGFVTLGLNVVANLVFDGTSWIKE